MDSGVIIMSLQTTAATITAKETDIHYIVGNNKMDYHGVIALVTDIMNQTLEYAIPIIKDWIRTYVAKRTGQLQDDLIKTLETSQWINNQLRLELGTMLQYAKELNKGGVVVRHNSEMEYAYYYGNYGKILLNDPQAQDKFWGLLKMESRKVLKESFSKARFKVCGGIGISGQSINRKLKVVI